MCRHAYQDTTIKSLPFLVSNKILIFPGQYQTVFTGDKIKMNMNGLRTTKACDSVEKDL